MTLVILAGGMATRLYPVTLEIPKSLIEINGKPFIQHQIDLIKSKGLRSIVLCLGQFAKPIEEYLNCGNSDVLSIQYSYDGETLLGTGGAIKKAFPLLSNPFMIIYGDSYLNIEYIDILNYFNNFNMLGLMTVLKNENKWDKSNIIFRDGRIIKYDKVDSAEFEYIDYGFSILRKEAFSQYLEKDKFDLKDVFRDLITREEMIGYEVFNRFYEIGSFKGIEETKEYLLKNKH
jgi:NDP-sugar pyrophosphorylase family protein